VEKSAMYLISLKPEISGTCIHHLTTILSGLYSSTTYKTKKYSITALSSYF